MHIYMVNWYSVIQPTTSLAVKMQGQFHCNGYMYDNLLFGDFDTVAYKVQLDDNYSAL